MLHCQALTCKKCSEDLRNTRSTDVITVNFIMAHPSNKRIFTQLCEDEVYQTLLLHTEIQWLPRGQVLVPFMEVQEKIMEFLLKYSVCTVPVSLCTELSRFYSAHRPAPRGDWVVLPILMSTYQKNCGWSTLTFPPSWAWNTSAVKMSFVTFKLILFKKKYFQENGYKKFWIVKGHSVAPRPTKHAVTQFSHLALHTCLRQPLVPL